MTIAEHLQQLKTVFPFINWTHNKHDEEGCEYIHSTSSLFSVRFYYESGDLEMYDLEDECIMYAEDWGSLLLQL